MICNAGGINRTTQHYVTSIQMVTVLGNPFFKLISFVRNILTKKNYKG